MFRITLDGHYQIIYTDFYKGDGAYKFVIMDVTNRIDLFVVDLDNQSDWSTITINAVIPINVDNGFGYVDIRLGLRTTHFGSTSPILDGAGYSTFFIKYLGD